MLLNLSIDFFSLQKLHKIIAFIQIVADIQPECQKVWISDEAPHVGPHLDPNCLLRSSTVLQNWFSKFTTRRQKVNQNWPLRRKCSDLQQFHHFTVYVRVHGLDPEPH